MTTSHLRARATTREHTGNLLLAFRPEYKDGLTSYFSTFALWQEAMEPTDDDMDPTDPSDPEEETPEGGDVMEPPKGTEKGSDID